MISAERISIIAAKATKTSVLFEKLSKRAADIACLVVMNLKGSRVAAVKSHWIIIGK